MVNFRRVRRFGAGMFAESAYLAMSAESALGLITLAQQHPTSSANALWRITSLGHDCD